MLNFFTTPKDINNLTNLTLKHIKLYKMSILPHSASYRLQQIALINPVWATTILDFVQRNPEFQPYVKFAPSSLKSHTKTTLSLSSMASVPRTVKDYMIYYICYAGVKTSLGQKYHQHVQTLTTPQEVEASTQLPARKRKYLQKAFNLPSTFSLTDLDRTKVAGIGVGGISYIKRNLAPDAPETKELVEYTDICFQKGLQKIYNLRKKPIQTSAKSIADTWGANRCVGNALCFQANVYG